MNVLLVSKKHLHLNIQARKNCTDSVYKLFILYSEFSEPLKVFSVLPQKYAKQFIFFYFIYCSLEMTDQDKDHEARDFIKNKISKHI